MRIDSITQNRIKEFYRAGTGVAELADHFGYDRGQIEKVLFPNGKARELPVVVHRTKVKKPDIPEPEVSQQEVPTEQEKQKSQKWIDAGKKAWETRQRRLAQATAVPPPKDQPVIENLATIRQEDKDEAVKLIIEAMEYFQVGMESIRKALELLKR